MNIIIRNFATNNVCRLDLLKIAVLPLTFVITPDRKIIYDILNSTLQMYPDQEFRAQIFYGNDSFSSALTKSFNGFNNKEELTRASQFLCEYLEGNLEEYTNENMDLNRHYVKVYIWLKIYK